MNRHGVTDAAARRVRGYPPLRFNEMLISDLDEAIANGRHGDEPAMRAGAIETLRAAGRYSGRVVDGEIDRLPEEARAQLGSLADGSGLATALKERRHEQSATAMSALLAEVQSLSGDRLRRKLSAIRRAIEPLPADRGRRLRQLALSWGAIPAWVGVYGEEAKLPEKTYAKPTKVFDRVTVWHPAQVAEPASAGSLDRWGDPRGLKPAARWKAEADLLARYAPTIVVEAPTDRSYSADFDRIGEVRLFSEGGEVDVQIDVSRPTIYSYTAEAKIHGQRYPQLVYVWWFPRRPAMSRRDPGAGHIDGSTLRITLDSQDRPAIFEVMLNCGCGHLAFVARHIETQAARTLRFPEPGKMFCVERAMPFKPDVKVAATVTVPKGAVHPVVYVAAGYHEVCRIEFDPSVATPLETHAYKLTEYDVLDRLPFADRVASMFGSDGLVHGAGRREGYLLAPTGMLSAGQPRKRGTQQIRWDAYHFDDPHLLERVLRLPERF